MELVLNFSSEKIGNVRNDKEAEWAIQAALDIHNIVCAIVNPLIAEYNEVWNDVELNALDEYGYINEEAPYNKCYKEMEQHIYDAMSYIYGVNKETKRIIKLNYPFIEIPIDSTENSYIVGHIEDFEM